MPLWMKRLTLIVVSLVIGFVVDYFIVVLPAPFGLETTVAEYSWGPEQIPLPYFFLTGVSLAFTFGLILDKFAGTEFLAD